MAGEPIEAEVTNVTEEWSRFLKRRYKKELAELSREYPYKHSLVIDYREIKNNELAFELLERPGKVIGDVKDAILEYNLVLLKGGKKPSLLNIRFINLPKKINARDIRAQHINKFVSVEGIIRKVTEVRPRIISARFQCKTCRHLTDPVPQGYKHFNEPEFCPVCEKKTKMEVLPALSEFIDAQKIRIQESPEGLRGGEQPQTIDVDVTDDMTGVVSPGDRVIVNGILRSIQRDSYNVKSTLFDIYIECNSIEMGEKEFEEVNISEDDENEIISLSQDPGIYKKIQQSIAPTIYGNESEKEAIALQLFGGIQKSMPDGSHLRGDIHILLVGDPGIAKSQMLRYVVELSPRGIYASGKSSTSAGLTATAVKDEFGDGRWTLEAGALVLADMGIACVDEMDKMNKDDRSSLHEAMEQQSISVAKAGITATLRSRCSLLGAANPKLGRFDKFLSIAEQINMPPSLLSRFDLIFIMYDDPDKMRDNAIASHIINTHRVGEMIRQNEISPVVDFDDEYINQQMAPIKPSIEKDFLRKYIAYSKRNCFPVLSDDARDVLVGYYMKLRSLAGEDKPVPVTARQLEALVRLAEASARVRLSGTIDVEDAERTVRIVDISLRQVAFDSESGEFDIDRVATGVPKKKRDVISEIRAAVSEVGDRNTMRARIDEVIEHLAGMGLDRVKAEEAVDQVIRSGMAYKPRHDLIQFL